MTNAKNLIYFNGTIFKSMIIIKQKVASHKKNIKSKHKHTRGFLSYNNSEIYLVMIIATICP